MTEEEYNIAWQISIRKALEFLDINLWDKVNNSRDYNLVFEGKKYPPKEVYKNAVDFFEKDYPESKVPILGGGIPTNNFLIRMGFNVTNKGIVETINIGDKSVYKFSMGVFLKDPKYRKLSIIERLEDLNAVVMHENTAYGQGSLFLNLIVGDYIYITYGKDKLGVFAKIAGEVFNLPEDLVLDINEEGYKGRKIEIVKPPLKNNTQKLVSDKRGWLPSGYSTLKKIKNLREANEILFKKYYGIELINSVDDLSINTMEKHKSTFPLNQILYGPPGTGKTYNTKELAVKIADPNFRIDKNLSDEEKRNAILEQYKILHQSEQIVFTTFHQSYSYEDFVEGIKPETIDGEVSYDTLPGLFKELCEKANIKSGSNFEEVLSQFKKDLISNDQITINTGTIEFDVFYKGGKTFRINPKGSRNENPRYPASIENILKLYQNVSDEGMYNPSYVTGILNYLYQNYALKKYDSLEDKNEKNYVLIIDEINRGNISAIFGELITLLEKDKRVGQKEEIKVKLPYSKTEFGIPSNVFIIGTMNTADRSVEALDTALRRRFVFKEIMPNPDLLTEHLFEGFNLKMVLDAINSRIEVLLDRDHTIGHSYFLGVDNLQKLSEVFKNCIIPLLQEYFYGDYEKIGWVIGEGFFEEKKIDKKAIFTKFFNEPKPEFEVNYQLADIDKIDIKQAIIKLLGKANDDNQSEDSED